MKTSPLLIRLFGKTKALKYESDYKKLSKKNNPQTAAILAIRKLKKSK